MEYAASIVIKFGESVDGAGSPAVIELDGELNVDAEGNVKTTFQAGDEPRILLHFDTDLYFIENIKLSSGMVVPMGDVVRGRSGSFDFVDQDAKANLPYIPAGGVAWQWFGNIPVLSRNKNAVSVSGGSLPATGDVTYDVKFKSYKLFPPTITLGVDEVYRILIVFTLGAI